MTPTTPPLQMLFALDAALDLMIDEGVETLWARHRALGEYARGRVRDLGLDLLADPAYASDSLTAIRVPDGLSARAIIDAMVADHRVMLQAGQGAMTDQVLRVGHMGWVTEADLVEAFEVLGATLERR
jgi:aspartate aminotransferase-like enzyme